MRQIRSGSPELRAAAAAARSAQNLKTRKANEREEGIAERARRRRKRISDSEAEAFMRRRVRVRAAPEDRSRGSNRTPRKLTNRSIREIYVGSWGDSCRRGADGMFSIHFEFVPRGFASKKGRSWRAGEAERASLYMTAHESLEDGELGWHSNVADDRSELRSFWRVLEALERHDRANANVYITEVIELPCEASPRLRRRIVKRLGARLESRGLAYVAAIHKPDRGGDQRNFHLHLMYSLRPCERIAAYEWDFGISKVGDINTKDGIKERRRCVVRDINTTLHAAHLAKRYTALSNGARGIEPSTQTKDGQNKTWANRRVLAAEQKIDEIHRLLAIAANLRETVERVHQAKEKAKQSVVAKLRIKARKIAENAAHREAVLSKIAARVDQARKAIQTKIHNARASAAFEEMFAESSPVSPIAKTPLKSECADARIAANVASKPAPNPLEPLTKDIPAADNSMLVEYTHGEDREPKVETRRRPGNADLPVQSAKASEHPQIAPAQSMAGASHRTSVKTASGQKHQAVVPEDGSVTTGQNALQPDTKAATVAAEPRSELAPAPVANDSIGSSRAPPKNEKKSGHHSFVSGTSAANDKPQFATGAETTSNDEPRSRPNLPGRATGDPLIGSDLAAILRRKSKSPAGAKRNENANITRARQAALERGQLTEENKKGQMARPADDLSPMQAFGSKPPTALAPEKAIAQTGRTSQTKCDPKVASLGEGRTKSSGSASEHQHDATEAGKHR